MPKPTPAVTKCARDVMTTRLLTVRPDDDVAKGVHVLLRQGISGMPVVEPDGRYHGVFSEKCCLRVLVRTAGLIDDPRDPPPRAREFMAKRLFALRPEVDVFQAIAALLKNHVSGAPVVDVDGAFLGSFSEKTSMRVLIASVYDQLPSADVGRFMDPGRERLIDSETDLLAVARIFVDTPFRRLPVVRDDRVIGQVSRRDVLRSSRILAAIVHQAAVDPESDDTVGDETAELLRALGDLPTTSIAAFMDTSARTIEEDLDLLSIANLFLTTPYRRLPVLRNGRCVGQVSRRDVLAAAYQLTDRPSPNESGTLYLSATLDRDQMPAL